MLVARQVGEMQSDLGMPEDDFAEGEFSADEFSEDDGAQDQYEDCEVLELEEDETWVPEGSRSPDWISGFEVSETATGLGVVSKNPLKKGVELGPIPGKHIDDPEYGSEYAIDLEDGRTLEPKAPFRYLNHSCEPNCCLVLHEEQDYDGSILGRSILLETLRKIKPGEQLTIDYGWTAEDAIPCLCGAKKCRQWVVAASELEHVIGQQAKS